MGAASAGVSHRRPRPALALRIGGGTFLEAVLRGPRLHPPAQIGRASSLKSHPVPVVKVVSTLRVQGSPASGGQSL